MTWAQGWFWADFYAWHSSPDVAVWVTAESIKRTAKAMAVMAEAIRQSGVTFAAASASMAGFLAAWQRNAVKFDGNSRD